MAAPQPASQPAPTLASFEDVVALIDARRDVRLKLDIDQYLRLINYRPGVITFEPAPGAPADLAGRLIARLKEWTGQPWLVAAEGGGGAESAWERQKREERETRAQIEADPFVRSVLEASPGARVVEVRQLPAPDAPADAPDEEDEE